MECVGSKRYCWNGVCLLSEQLLQWSVSALCGTVGMKCVWSMRNYWNGVCRLSEVLLEQCVCSTRYYMKQCVCPIRYNWSVVCLLL